MKIRRQTEWHIPIYLITYAVTNNLNYELQLYMYLKCSSYGIVKLNKELISDCSIALQVTPKTIKSRIKKLVEMGWVAKFKTTQHMQIRSFDKVCKIHELYSRISSVFCVDYVGDFNSYIGAAVYTHFYLASKKRNQRRDAANMDTALAPAPGFLYGYPVAINGVAQCLKISISKSARMKTAAAKSGFIKVTSNNTELVLNASFKNFVSKGSINSQAFFPINETLFHKNPDLIVSKLRKSYRRR